MKVSLTVLIVSLAAAGAGCTTGEILHRSGNAIDVRSQPPGAVVQVMGKELGTTPLRVPVSTVFPVSYPPEHTADYGRIRLVKEGCQPFELAVSSAVVNHGLDARLQCNTVVADNPAASTPEAGPGQTIPPGSLETQAVERLRAIETLHKQELISDDEYQHLRARVLDGL